MPGKCAVNFDNLIKPSRALVCKCARLSNNSDAQCVRAKPARTERVLDDGVLGGVRPPSRRTQCARC